MVSPPRAEAPGVPAIVPSQLPPTGWLARTPGGPPPTLRQVGVDALQGRRVLETSNCAGTYGMGGPGFLALRLTATNDRPEEWLILALWCADNWCHFDGLPLEALPGQVPEVFGYPRFAQAVRGQIVQVLLMEDRACRLGLGDHTLEIHEDPARRPPHAGDGTPRALEPGESLLDAWVLAPTTGLHV